VKAEIGIIGGSGLYSMPGFEASEEVFIESPFGPPSDNYVLGELAGRQVAFLARHGRGHSISPSELNFRANIYGMKRLGVERILSDEAIGARAREMARWAAGHDGGAGAAELLEAMPSPASSLRRTSTVT